jgi:Domain of unknown function (DUF6371)
MERFNFSKRRNLVKYCPCGKSNDNGKFAPFEGYTNCGYCHSCDRTFYPDKSTIVESIGKKDIPLTIITHSLELVEKTVLEESKNNFILFLRTIATNNEVNEVVKKYLIGTWNAWEGITVFWQIDKDEKVLHGKLMQYDPKTGKRSKHENGSAIIDSVKNRLNLKNVKTKQCLFGLHLINENTKRVALVEAEKTAIIMSIFKPEYTWLATGGKVGFKNELMVPIKPCKIIAFPDKSEYTDWLLKAIELNKSGFNIKVDDLLENMDYPDGTDLADVYIDLKKAELSPKIRQPLKDHEFSNISKELYRKFQERKCQKIELTKEESYKAIQYCIDNNTDTYRVLYK